MTENAVATRPILLPSFDRLPLTWAEPERDPERDPESDPETDEGLVAAIAAGDDTALGRLYDRYSGMALAVLERILGQGGEAEEILQEVFLQVWRQAGRYRPELASARGWLMLLVRSRAFDRLKAGRAARRREDTLGGREASWTTEPEGTERLERSREQVRVRQALATLPAEQREAIELAFFSGLTHGEVAARLGAPLGTVKSRILLGMRKLRSFLAEPAGRRAPASSRRQLVH